MYMSIQYLLLVRFIDFKCFNESNTECLLTAFRCLFCRMLPKARVVYCSATGVSDVKNMVCNALLHKFHKPLFECQDKTLSNREQK